MMSPHHPRGRLLAFAAATSALALASALRPDRPSMWMCDNALTGVPTDMVVSQDGGYAAVITKNGDMSAANYQVSVHQWISPLPDQDMYPPTEDGSYSGGSSNYGYRLPVFNGGSAMAPTMAPMISPMFSWYDFPVDIAFAPTSSPSPSMPAIAVLTSRRRPCYITDTMTACALGSNGTNDTTPGSPAPVPPTLFPPPVHPSVNPPTFENNDAPQPPTPEPPVGPVAGTPNINLPIIDGNPCYGCGSITVGQMGKMAWVGGKFDEVCWADGTTLVDGSDNGVICAAHPRDMYKPASINLRNVTMNSMETMIYYIAIEGGYNSQLCWADISQLQSGKITGIQCTSYETGYPGSSSFGGGGMMGLTMVGLGPSPATDERLFFGWNDMACVARPDGLTPMSLSGISCTSGTGASDPLVGGAVGVSGDGSTMAWGIDSAGFYKMCKVSMTHSAGMDTTFGQAVCTGQLTNLPTAAASDGSPLPMKLEVPSVNKDGKFIVWGDGTTYSTGHSVCAMSMDQMVEGVTAGFTCSNNVWHPESTSSEYGQSASPRKVTASKENRLYWFISSGDSGAISDLICAGWVFEPPTHTPTKTSTVVPTMTTLPTYTPAYNDPADAASFAPGAVADSTVCKTIKRIGNTNVDPKWNIDMIEGDLPDPFVAIATNEWNSKRVCFGRYSEITSDPATYKCTSAYPNSVSIERVIIKGTDIVFRVQSKTCVIDTTTFVHEGTTGLKCTAAETALAACSATGEDRDGCGQLTNLPGSKFIITGVEKERVCVGDVGMMNDGTWDGIICTSDIVEDLLGARASDDGNTVVVAGDRKYCIIDIPSMVDGTMTGVKCITIPTSQDPSVDISPDGTMVTFGLMNYIASNPNPEFTICKISTSDITDGAAYMNLATCSNAPRHWLHPDGASTNMASPIVFWSPGRIVFTVKYARALCWVDPMQMEAGTSMGVHCTKHFSHTEFSPFRASPDKTWFATSRIHHETCLVTPWMLEPQTFNGINCIGYSGNINKPGGAAVDGGKMLIGTTYEQICLVDTTPATPPPAPPALTPTPEATLTEDATVTPDATEAMCRAISDCAACQAESDCGYCSTTMTCHSSANNAACANPGCKVGCGMTKPSGFGCFSDSVFDRSTQMCRCKGRHRNYCDMTTHMCAPKAQCDEMAAADQPCVSRATRPAGVSLSTPHTCTCNPKNGNTPTCTTKSNGKKSCIMTRDWSAVNGGASGSVDVEDGSTIDVSTDETYTGATVNVGSGSGDCEMTNSGGADSTLTVNDLQVGVNTFTTERVSIMAQYMLLSTPLFWANPRVTVSTSMTISSTTTFADEDGSSDLTIDGTANIHTQPNAPVTFGSRYTQSATATANFEDDVEFSGQHVDIAGSVSLSKKILFRSPLVTLAAITTAVTSSATMEVEGGTVTVTSTAVINMFLFVRTNSIGTGVHKHRRQAATMAADPTGYSTNMPAAGTFNSPVSVDDTFLAPTNGVAFNSDLRMSENSLLYLDDSWNPSVLNIAGTFTCENCKIELDFGNSATAASFPADTTLTVLEAGEIMGAAHVSVAAGEGISGDFVWTTEKVSVAGGRWQLRVTKHATPGPIISGPLLRSGLMAVTIKDSLKPGLTEASYAAEITTRVNTLFARNGGMWGSIPFTVTVHKLMASVHPGHTIAYFTFTSTEEAMMDFTWWIQTYFKYHKMDFGAMHEVQMQSTKFQCAAADSPASGEKIYACNDAYFASEATCATQTLTDVSCGADRKENCSVRPEDSTNCWLVSSTP